MQSLSFCVAVPVGREDERLAMALRSLVAQDVALNIALLDASGSDRVRTIARGFENDLALRVHRPDEGQASAVGAGWAQTAGDILCWLNADDALLPDTLREVADIFARQPETDVVYGHSVLRDARGRTTGYHMAVDRVSDAIYRTNLVSQPSCFVRRSAVDDVGGINTRLHYAMDWDLWIRLYAAGKRFHFIDAPLSTVVWESGTKTASVSARRLYEIFRLVQRWAGPAAAFDTLVGVLSHHLGNYTALAAPRRKLRLHHPRAADKSIGGLDRDGKVADTARIPLANLAPAASATLIVHCAGARDGMRRIAIGDQAFHEAFQDHMRITLPAPVQPGEKRWLTISAAPEREVRFLSAHYEVPRAVRSAARPPADQFADGPHVRLENCTVSIPETGSVKTLKQTVVNRGGAPAAERVLLRDINLDAAPGDRIGIVGRNGVGKTSLLRLIAGIYPASAGTRSVHGRIAPVLALGRGLDPELSLRANVSLGLIHSNRNDLYSEEFVHEILDFAELADRAQDPLRRLSAGLQARFAFSLSIHQAPDILILDEIFTIGDVSFVEKAQAEILRRLDESPILFIASHDEDEITAVCSRAILLHDGRIELDADPKTVFAAYRKLLAKR